MALGGCDFKDALLEPQQPGVISPEDVKGATGAQALRVGAIGRLQRLVGGGNGNQPNVWQISGMLADEWKSSDSFTQTTQQDSRNILSNDGLVANEFTVIQQTRGSARDALKALTEFAPTRPWEAGEMYAIIAFAELTLAENFCNGIPLGEMVDGVPNYTAPLTNADVFASAVAHLDSALALSTSTDTASVRVRREALVMKARALVGQKKFAEAAALVPVSAVPTSFQYAMTFAQTSQDNTMWGMSINLQRYSVSDSFDVTGIVKNALPFASAKDPRVPVVGTTLNSQFKGTDGTTSQVRQQLWPTRDAAVPVVTGIDARLIEAEARLNTGDIAGMMTILNALRTSAQKLGDINVAAMAELAAPSTQADAVSLFFREKAFWTFGRGQRLGDLRRLIRQYGRTQDQVFPTGTFFKGGIPYGIDVNLPVTDNERTNPNFKGCVDRSA
jgi:hypothetical protein